MTSSNATPDRTEGTRISKSGHDISRLSKAEVEKRSAGLEPLQRMVTCDAGTERAGTGALLNEKREGTYLCVVCDLPLYRSNTKFESGTGWPSFYEPFDSEHVENVEDSSLGMRRTENRCARCGSHLGHVFDDGPRPTGLRYCMNSAALRFIPTGDALPPDARPVREHSDDR